MAKDANTQVITPANMMLQEADASGITLRINGGNAEGKLSSTGKSLVLVSDKVKFTRADGKEVVVQVTAYIPVGK